ncbi:MAG: amidohydrolase [Cyclobacteriaceae bacterium]|nr:amidohydrolase [Cyclobacteriaceae bacterium]
MNKLLPLILFVTLLSCSGRKPADLVITGGTIYTMDTSQRVVEAVVVNADTIVFAGSSQAAREWIGDETKVIDLQGKTMIPGFIEGHGHFMGVGYNELDLDLSGVKSFEEIAERVKIAASKAKPGEWILGRGWHQDKWDTRPADMVKGYPSHAQLSAVSPDNPVFLSHASGHMSLANAKAMEIAGVNQLSKENLNKFSGEGGEIIRDANGNPTGLFNENAEDVIARFIPANDSERMSKAFELATQTCLKNGITGFHDAGVGREGIDFYKSQYKLGKLGLRMYVMVTGWDRPLVHEWLKKGPEVDPKHWLTIRSIKLNCDGALGSRGAWLLEPYTDRPDFYGMATLSMDTVLSTSREALKSGFQVCSHAIGDRANREILDRYELAMKENPDVKDSRFRIEHAQHLNPTDIPRFAKLGVIPAMQAIHMASDRQWAIDRLGEKRIKEGAYMWQSLLKSGAKIVNGTDAPVEPVNPIPSFYASVTRMTLKGQPEGGYEPEEKMTREQALRSYTLDAAYGAFEEKFKGSIEKGKLADFAILSKDIMTVPDKEILSAEVLTTIVGGKVVYEKK